MKDLFQKAKESRERHKEKINADLRERVRYETKDTLSFFDRQRAKGKTDREIIKDLEKSKYKGQ